MNITIEFNTNNASFDDSLEIQAREIIEQSKDIFSLLLQEKSVLPYKLFDSNGNSIGTVQLSNFDATQDTQYSEHEIPLTPRQEYNPPSEQGQISILYMSIVAILTGIIAGQSVIFNCLDKLIYVLR